MRRFSRIENTITSYRNLMLQTKNLLLYIILSTAPLASRGSVFRGVRTDQKKPKNYYA